MELQEMATEGLKVKFKVLVKNAVVLNPLQPHGL